MAMIDNVFNTSPQDKEEYFKRMDEVSKNIQQSFTKGKISQSQYELLNDKILQCKNNFNNRQ
jgi:hypothetical protein